MCLAHSVVVLHLSRFECRTFSRGVSIFLYESEADGSLRAVEELAGQSDHARVVAQLVGGEPELGLEADGGGAGVGAVYVGLASGHAQGVAGQMAFGTKELREIAGIPPDRKPPYGLVS